MSLLLMTALMLFSAYTCERADVANIRLQPVSVIVVNSSSLPVRLEAAKGACSLGETSIDYSLTNTSKDEIKRVEFRAFIVDSTGKLLDVKEYGSTTRIPAGATQHDRATIKAIVGSENQLLLAVDRVIMNVGVWQIDGTLLEASIRKQFFLQSETGINATFEPNIVITQHDKKQIFELIVKNLIHDEHKMEKLQGQPDLIVLRRSVDFPLPEIEQKKLLLLNEDEIQEIADQAKRVVFLSYEPLTVEGSRVLAKIAIRDAVTRKKGAFVQYKYSFVFTCAKQDDVWVIEASMGYAQS